MERGLMHSSEGLAQLPDWLQETIQERGWQRFVATPEPTVTEVVREFYSNFIAHEWPTVITVCEVPVLFSTEALNNLFELETGKCVFYVCRGVFGEDELVEVMEMIAPGDVWDVDANDNLQMRRTN